MKVVNRILGEAVRPPDSLELCEPEYALQYAIDVLHSRWPEGESTIAKDPGWAVDYAKHFGRFPEAEAKIIEYPELAYIYARDVIKGRWPEAESGLAKDPYLAYRYAFRVINRRFHEGEPVIAKSPYMKDYLGFFPDAKDDWVLQGWIDWLDT